MMNLIRKMFRENVNEDIYELTTNYQQKSFKISKNPNTSHKPSDWFI